MSLILMRKTPSSPVPASCTLRETYTGNVSCAAPSVPVASPSHWKKSLHIQKAMEEDSDLFQRHVTSEKVHLQSQTRGVKLVRTYHTRSKSAILLGHLTLTKGRTVPFLLGLKSESSQTPARHTDHRALFLVCQSRK